MQGHGLSAAAPSKRVAFSPALTPARPLSHGHACLPSSPRRATSCPLYPGCCPTHLNMVGPPGNNVRGLINGRAVLTDADVQVRMKAIESDMIAIDDMLSRRATALKPTCDGKASAGEGTAENGEKPAAPAKAKAGISKWNTGESKAQLLAGYAPKSLTKPALDAVANATPSLSRVTELELQKVIEEKPEPGNPKQATSQPRLSKKPALEGVANAESTRIQIAEVLQELREGMSRSASLKKAAAPVNDALKPRIVEKPVREDVGKTLTTDVSAEKRGNPRFGQPEQSHLERESNLDRAVREMPRLFDGIFKESSKKVVEAKVDKVAQPQADDAPQPQSGATRATFQQLNPNHEADWTRLISREKQIYQANQAKRVAARGIFEVFPAPPVPASGGSELSRRVFRSVVNPPKPTPVNEVKPLRRGQGNGIAPAVAVPVPSIGSVSSLPVNEPASPRAKQGTAPIVAVPYQFVATTPKPVQPILKEAPTPKADRRKVSFKLEQAEATKLTETAPVQSQRDECTVKSAQLLSEEAAVLKLNLSQSTEAAAAAATAPAPSPRSTPKSALTRPRRVSFKPDQAQSADVNDKEREQCTAKSSQLISEEAALLKSQPQEAPTPVLTPTDAAVVSQAAAEKSATISHPPAVVVEKKPEEELYGFPLRQLVRSAQLYNRDLCTSRQFRAVATPDCVILTLVRAETRDAVVAAEKAKTTTVDVVTEPKPVSSSVSEAVLSKTPSAKKLVARKSLEALPSAAGAVAADEQGVKRCDQQGGVIPREEDASKLKGSLLLRRTSESGTGVISTAETPSELDAEFIHSAYSALGSRQLAGVDKNHLDLTTSKFFEDAFPLARQNRILAVSPTAFVARLDLPEVAVSRPQNGQFYLTSAGTALARQIAASMKDAAVPMLFPPNIVARLPAKGASVSLTEAVRPQPRKPTESKPVTRSTFDMAEFLQGMEQMLPQLRLSTAPKPPTDPAELMQRRVAFFDLKQGTCSRLGFATRLKFEAYMCRFDSVQEFSEFSVVMVYIRGLKSRVLKALLIKDCVTTMCRAEEVTRHFARAVETMKVLSGGKFKPAHIPMSYWTLPDKQQAQKDKNESQM